MCGISGYISNNNKLSKSDFIRATNAMNHRGPDAEGFYENENQTLFLGHKRLSIIDLSPASNQPFFSNCGRYVMVYNGELYNFKEIKEQLQLQTRTTGDTEVILEAFIKIGTKSFELLNGMFAFIIYDIQEQKVIVCRDRIGIKPLFYYFDGEQIAFASEIKALKAIPGFKKEINYAAIPEFLHLGFISEPNTIYKYVHKFPTATYSIFTVKEIKNDFLLPITSYWKLENAIEPTTKKDFITTKKELKDLLINSDSAKYDESEHAKNVAKHLGTDHYAFQLTEDEVEEILSDIIFHYDEPFADASAYPTMIVSKLARQHVTVTLSGDGADELFLGYGMYNWASRLANPIVQTFRKPVYWATQHAGLIYKRGGLLLDYPSLEHIHTHIFSQEQYFHSEKDLKHLLLDENFNFDRINEEANPEKRNLSPKGKQSFGTLITI